MKHVKSKLLLTIIFINILFLTGCWSYKEIDKLSIVSGVSIDKGSQNNKYLVTVEIISPQGGKESKIDAKIVGAEGETIFDAIRNIIKYPGKKLFWSHAKVLIISEDLAREGLIPLIDWMERGAESRLEAHILISREKTAAAIWQKSNILSDVRAYEIHDTLTFGLNSSKAAEAEVYRFIEDLSNSGISAVLPTIKLSVNNGTYTSDVSGAAIFNKDKLVGFINEDETKLLLFVKDQIKGGILPEKEPEDNPKADISLEIYKSTTKIKPVYADEKLTMNIDIKTFVNIAENGTTKNNMDEEGRAKLKKDAEAKLEEEITSFIKKIQSEYGNDIFGFGNTLRMDMPELWKSMEPDWETKFKDLDVKVNAEINIRGSVLTSKPIKSGE